MTPNIIIQIIKLICTLIMLKYARNGEITMTIYWSTLTIICGQLDCATKLHDGTGENNG